MAADINDAFKIQYESEFQHALQQMGSKLRDTVWNKRVSGSSVRFPILGEATSEKNKARHSDLAGDGDAHSNVTAVLDNYVSHRYLDVLDEFKADADYRQGYTQSIVAKLGRDLDEVILDAAAASNTSFGSAAGMDKALLRGVREAVGENDWMADEWCWVVTPAVFSDVLGITEVLSSDYQQGGYFGDGAKGRSVKAMGFTFIESSILNSATYWTSATVHKTYVYNKNSIGLGIGKDITPRIDYVPEKTSTLIAAVMSAGATTIQPASIYEVAVNGL